MSYSQTPQAYSPPEPEPPSPVYYSHSIMSIRMTLHYIITSPCLYYYPTTSLIAIHIIHISFSYYKHVIVSSRAQRRLTLRQSCLPSLARIIRHGRANQRARLSPSRANMQMSAPISSLIPVRMSTVLLLQ